MSINSHDFFFQIHHNVFGSVKLCSFMMWLSFFGGDIRKFLENCGAGKEKEICVFKTSNKINQNNNEIIKSVIVFMT